MNNNLNLMSQLLDLPLPNIADMGYGAIAGIIAWLRGRYNDKPLKRCFFDALICSFIAFSVRDLLVFMDVTTDLSYFSSVVIGYMGTDYLSILLRGKLEAKNININIGKKDEK
ncbi:phage holin, lambda family [Yersinia alsatica]|uniref:phage holin, lambda family n=1 Tax=Yersinia alsatica TaxID=2890317 RepID=UPI0011A9FBC9|nr:phage holin, lambda family [Yersinia alsatica]